MVTEPPKSVAMTVVVDHVEPVPLVNTAVEEVVVVNQLVPDVNAVTTVVEVSHVENALPLKHVQMESVLEPPAVIVLEEPVVTTETEEAVDHAQLVKDAEGVFVNATTTVMKEIVATVLNLREQTKDSALLDLVELVQLASPVELMVDALQFSNVLSQSQLLIVHPGERLEWPVLSQFL